MPITQDRMVAVITTATSLMQMLDALHAHTQRLNLATLRTKANAFLAQSDDEIAKTLVREALSAIYILYELINSANLPPDARENLIEERVHFKKYYKSNQNVARYNKAIRSRDRDIAESVRLIPQFFTEDNISSEEPNLEPNLEPKPIPYSPTPGDPGFVPIEERTRQRQLREAKEAAKLSPTEPEPPLPDQRSEGLPASAKAKAEPEPNKNLKIGEKQHITQNGSKIKLSQTQVYKDPDLVATSVPTLEELNELPIKPGSDIF